MSFNESAFAAHIGRLGLNHFGYKELLVGRYRALNGPPPLRLWDNIVPTILVVDALRSHLGKSIKLISAYRTEAYNDPSKNAGRAPRSQHQAFSALDIRVTGMAPAAVAKILESWQDKEWFWSPVQFQRKAEKVKAGRIPFGELPRKVKAGPLGCFFTVRGFVKPYPGSNFTHIDTRGMKSSKA